MSPWECHCAVCPVPLTGWGIPRAAPASWDISMYLPSSPTSLSLSLGGSAFVICAPWWAGELGMAVQHLCPSHPHCCFSFFLLHKTQTAPVTPARRPWHSSDASVEEPELCVLKIACFLSRIFLCVVSQGFDWSLPGYLSFVSQALDQDRLLGVVLCSLNGITTRWVVFHQSPLLFLPCLSLKWVTGISPLPVFHSERISL